MKTYKLNGTEVKEINSHLYDIWEGKIVTDVEYREMVKNNLWARPKYKRAITVIYETIFENVKSSIVEIIDEEKNP